MCAAIHSSHATFVQAFVDPVFISESLAEQRIGRLFQANAVGGTQGGCVRIFNSALRAFFHRAIRASLSSWLGELSGYHTASRLPKLSPLETKTDAKKYADITLELKTA